MKTRILLIFFIFKTMILFSQIPADSLVGIYCGEKWKADPAGSQWVITIDTIRVYYIDSTICQAKWWANNSSSQNYTYCTDYFSCYNANPQGPHMKFYSGDSVRKINDYMPQPYPNPPIAVRLYGKRIPGSNGTVGITETPGKGRMDVFPNPFSKEITIESGNSEIEEIIIFSISGKPVYQNSCLPAKTINLDFLKNGMYLIEINTKTGTIHQKIVKIP